jgi:molecular chaperone GrpE
MSESKQTIDQSELDQQRADEHDGKSPGAGAPGDRAEQATSADAADAALAATGADVGADGVADELQVDLDELGALAAKRDEYLALAQRTQADFENYRKRVARESAIAQQRGVAKLAKELLPAIDNLDRALDAAASDDPLLDGVRLVRSELSAALARVGVESFSPLGEPFDPSVHEAMATVQQPDDGGAESNVVVEVYQPGYRLADSVIRPARVVVAA